jgi:hypothetical protein
MEYRLTTQVGNGQIVVELSSSGFRISFALRVHEFDDSGWTQLRAVREYCILYMWNLHGIAALQ